MKILCGAAFLLFINTFNQVFAQSGQDLSSVSFTGKCRLSLETFNETLNDPKSSAYISLKDAFEEQLVDEISSQLNSQSLTFDSVTVNVTGFTNGSVIVNFILVIDGTPITISELVDAATTVSADGSIGNFTVEQIEDLDECQQTSTTCSEFADCVNTIGSFRCDCESDTFDQSGDGSICVTPVTVLCEASRMELTISRAYLESLSITLGFLRLEDEGCGGALNSTSDEYEFTISDDLSNCGSSRSSNDTHVTYENVLSNKPKSDAVIVTGTNISIPFRCSYPKNLTTTITFEGEVASINISTPGGEGSFGVGLKLYTTESFTEEETKTEFRTTDSLFLQAELNSDDNALAVVLDRCWATPTSQLDDTTQYDIITSGCEVSSAVSGSVAVIRNGEDNQSRFRVQVFTFIDETSTYIHCSLVVCSTAGGNVCQPACPASGSTRRRREIRDHKTVTLSRRRRESAAEQDKTIGPFYRVTDGAVDVRFWAVTMTLVLFVLVLLFTIGFLVRKLRSRSNRGAAGMKTKSYAVDNCSYE